MALNLMSRKFILSLLIVLVNGWLVYDQAISDGVYSTVMVATIAAYLTSNVISNKDVLSSGKSLSNPRD